MSPENLSPKALPSKLSESVNQVWDYHKYIPYTSDGKYDHIYAYGTPTAVEMDGMMPYEMDATEYSIRAQLVQYQQYQALFEGYLLYQWIYYAAVLMWKSQSPWPAFRGALYESYLDQTGGYWGARAACSMTTGKTI